MYNWDADAVNNETSHIPRPSYNEQGARVETVRGTRRAPTSPRRLADARRSERKRAAQLCRSRLHAHPSRRPPPEQSEASSAPASRRALALNRRTLSNFRGTFAAAASTNAFQVGGPKRRTRERRQGTEETFEAHPFTRARSCLPMSIRNVSDYGVKQLALHRRVRARPRD